ncbi:uncharacterized protein F4817DRAFT_328740 [Daldinia loculata]|uniref:uncharacterized protein n=1 Tax=Daldinia loculata TaxID=103429 RepID=UPI0020C380AF|nr:uncharacterized protein F4817DRAFT_328740 [Daldinia loculata]KAI1650241.1 hypothetical protein F4817DRAFT_328740 [Daldinia loculata]
MAFLKNINFITNISTSPSWLKKRLVERPESPFFQRSQALFYKTPRGQEIRVDISPEWLSPYLPDSAVRVQDILPNEIPYISLTDLIVFKLDSSGLRSNPVKKERDAQDAAALVAFATHKSFLQLSKKQEQVVEEALCDVAKCGTKEKDWWERRMGLTKNAADGSSFDSGGRKRKKNRPHSKSDPSLSKSPLTSDPHAAWHYERLDHAHIRRFNSLHSSQSANRPGTPRPSSQRIIRDNMGFTMTQPKTTHASYQLGARRPGLSNETSADSNHYDEQYYTLEPGESLSGQASPAGYFDVTRTPAGAHGTVTEHTVGVRRSSKSGYFDLTPGATPSAAPQPRRPPGLDKRSVTFLL